MTGSPLHSVALRFTETLAKHRSGDLIRHPETGNPPPHDQYATSCFAVAALRAGAHYGRGDLLEEGVNALQAFLHRDLADRGHAEFNTFALLEVVGDQRAGIYETGISEAELLNQTEFDASPVSNQGNNWLLLQALSRLRRADFSNSALDSLRARRQLRLARRWQLADGVFADQPRYLLSPAETPLTYHAKMTYLATRIGEYYPSWYQSALDGLRALYRASLPTGESLYFGRSENSIFGYASLIAAIDRYIAAEEDVPDWLLAYRNRVEGFFMQTFDPIELNSQPTDTEAGVIDEYIYDVVYSAYAAMLLLDVSADRSMSDRQRIERESYYLPDSGLLAVEGRETAVALATHGQVKLHDGRPDLRYAGMFPHAISHDDNPMHPGVPVKYYKGGPPPFLPTVRIDGNAFLPATWTLKSHHVGDTVEMNGFGEYYPMAEVKQNDKEGVSEEHSVHDLVAAAVNRTRTRILYERWKKRPSQVDVRTERTIRYDTGRDVLLVATTTRSSRGDATIRPSSSLVTPEFTNAIEYRAQPNTEWSTDEVHGHRGPGAQIVGEPLNADEVCSILVFDPRENVDTIKIDERGTWVVEFQDGTSTMIGSH